MGSGKVSKNSRTSKKVETMLPKRVKPKKEYILVELTNAVKEEIKDDLSVYRDKPIIEIIRRYGKDYLRLPN